ncbi:protein UXT-like isoform X1 [Acanthaster planci]|uniref:Protein UXT-like isoform X1 n=1 Tax=Acanthaster planci TaxID=133434 RepID=A0A8B7XQQ4_ACAPL|nr:protein UXT-like isoform X1 [Acanthaster planci]
MEGVSSKVTEYEKFVNEVLRRDLQKVLDERDQIYEQAAHYLQLKTTIEKLQEANLSKDTLKTKIDLGCNFYVQANVPDASRIYVLVGFGFFVEFTLPEALKFIDKKCKHLTSLSDKLTKDSAEIKANIKLVYEGLRELQHLESDVVDDRDRPVW